MMECPLPKCGGKLTHVKCRKCDEWSNHHFYTCEKCDTPSVLVVVTNHEGLNIKAEWWRYDNSTGLLWR